MSTTIADVTRLYGDWVNLEWSKEKILLAAIALPVLLVGTANLPLLLFVFGLWIIYVRTVRIATLFASSIWAVVFRKIWTASSIDGNKKRNIVGLLGHTDTTEIGAPIPGKNGLSCVGETVSYLSSPIRFLAERRTAYGDVFAASLDFSGTFLAARRVVFMFHSDALQTERLGSAHANTAVSAHSPTRAAAAGASDNSSPQRRSPNKASTTSPTRATLISAHHTTTTGSAGAGAARLNRKLQVLGYAGLYGASCHGGDLRQRCIPALAERVLGEHRHRDAWEDAATPVIQAFLRRLIFDGAAFSLADRVNELACELVGSLFLGIPGFSPALLALLDNYLSTALHNPAFNASQAHRKRLSACIHIAMFEEDQRFLSRDWRDFDADIELQGGEGTSGCAGMLGEVMEVCADILQQRNPSAHSGDDAAGGKRDAMQQDLVFVFVAEVVYPTLLRQLRALIESITQDKRAPNREQQRAEASGTAGDVFVSASASAAGTVGTAAAASAAGPSECRESYAAYLSARQLVGNVSGSGLARFSWASTIYPEGGDESKLAEEGYARSTQVDPMSERGEWGAAGTMAPDRQSNDLLQDIPCEPVEAGGRSNIGSYLLSQLSWPLSPAVTSPTKGIAARHEPLQEYQRGAATAAASTTIASKRHSCNRHAGEAGRGTALPIAQSCDAPAGISSSDSELCYSSSPSTGRPPALRTAYLGHLPLTASILEPQSTPAVMQHVGRRGVSQVTPSAPQTPASSASWKRPSANLGQGSTGGKRRYNGRFGYRHTPGRTPGKTSGKGYSVVTPSRSDMRVQGDSVCNSPEVATLKTGGHSSYGDARGSRRGAVAMTPGSEAGSGAGTPNKTSWRYREGLIVRYVTSIKELVTRCKESTLEDDENTLVNSTLSQCRQSFDVLYTPSEGGTPLSPVQYTVNKGDLVVRVFPPHSDLGPRTGADGIGPSPTPTQVAVPACRDLGAFSDLVLAIFAHELVTGFEWDAAVDSALASSTTNTTSSSGLNRGAQVGSLRAPRSYEVLHRETAPSSGQAALQVLASIAATVLPAGSSSAEPGPARGENAGLVRKFRARPEHIAFLVSTGDVEAEGSEGDGDYGAIGGGALMRCWLQTEEEDARYYSDGL